MMFMINFKKLGTEIINNEKYSLHLSFVPFVQYSG
jgi:hypothetical protein